ncbi:hypothetical protein D3C75_702130 [compost metagenome]
MYRFPCITAKLLNIPFISPIGDLIDILPILYFFQYGCPFCLPVQVNTAAAHIRVLCRHGLSEIEEGGLARFKRFLMPGNLKAILP